MALAKENHPFLSDLSPDAEMTGTVFRKPVNGRENIAIVVNALDSFYQEQRIVYLEQTASRTFLEYDARLYSGITLRAIVVIDKNDLDLISHVSVRVEPLGAALTIAANLGPIVGLLIS